MLSLQLSPRSNAADQVVRNAGSNPKSVMRLMNTEPVSKLSEYLVRKWRLEENNFALSLYCRGSKMQQEDVLSVYMESSLSVKIPIEFDFFSSALEEAETASSTPVGSPDASPVTEETSALTAIEKPVVITTSERKRPKERSVNHNAQEESRSSCSPVKKQTSDGKIEQIYREMLDREKDIFMSILDSQARWLSQVQTQMVNTCLAAQEKALSLVMARDADEEGEKRHKKTHK